MILLKNEIEKMFRMERKANSNKRKGYSFENCMHIQFDVNKSGNVIFDGWLKNHNTWYQQTEGFSVEWDCENQKFAVISTKNSFEISQDIVDEIGKAIEDLYNSNY